MSRRLSHYFSRLSRPIFSLNQPQCISGCFLSSRFSSTFSHRSHTCGELQADHVGEKVKLCGWLQHQRMGYFLVLRDAHGTTQVTMPTTENTDLAHILPLLRYESVIEVTGTVQRRPDSQHNPDMVTGEVEVLADNLKLLNPCRKDLPFSIKDKSPETKESLRLMHRYLDLRRSTLQRNLRLRSSLTHKMRQFLFDKHGFVDVETPTLFRRTPGGAREFVVPTHELDKFYTLPQSPQQFKQLLMIGGIDRYMQIARCYRDEGAKPDRQPEFTQLDLELSFVDQRGVQELVEGLLEHCWPSHLPALTTPFPRMTYAHAMRNYGSDKPDTRFDMKLVDVSHMLHGEVQDQHLFALADAAARYPTTSVQAINFTGAGAILSNADLKALSEDSKQFITLHSTEENKLWLAAVRVKEGGAWQGSLARHLGEDLHNQLNLHLHLVEGDLLLLAAGEHVTACSLLGRLRLDVANKMETHGHAVRGEEGEMRPLWVEDFPLFLPDEDGMGRLESAHHPFTAPHHDDIELVYKHPEGARSQHYDLVLNGCEIGGGSIRIHQAALQRYILTNVLKEDARPLEHLLEALDYGCPPHGGIALGLDRLLSIMCGADSIRDVIAFPKSGSGRDLMAQAPAAITADDRKYYFLPESDEPESDTDSS